jgi:hypothetical protein
MLAAAASVVSIKGNIDNRGLFVLSVALTLDRCNNDFLCPAYKSADYGG